MSHSLSPATATVLSYGAHRGPSSGDTAAWLTLVVSTATLLLVRGPYERGTGLTDAIDSTVLSATLTTRPGLALLARPALLAAAFFLVRRSARRTTHPAPGIALSVALAVSELRLTFTLRAHTPANSWPVEGSAECATNLWTSPWRSGPGGGTSEGWPSGRSPARAVRSPCAPALAPPTSTPTVPALLEWNGTAWETVGVAANAAEARKFPGHVCAPAPEGASGGRPTGQEPGTGRHRKP